MSNNSAVLETIRRDVALIKSILSEGELTEWAKDELVEARVQDENSFVSLEDL